MNVCIFMGRLVRDPEERSTTSGMTITRYTIAVDRKRKKDGDQQTADFIPCVAFDKAGDFAAKYFHKGMRVLVRGRMQTGSYTNKEGNKVNTFELILDDQNFADSKSAGNGAEGPRMAQNDTKDGFIDVPTGMDDNELPFV